MTNDTDRMRWLEEQVRNLVIEADEAEALAHAIAEHIRERRERARILTERAEAARKTIARMLDEHGLKTMRLGVGTVSVVEGRKSLHLDDDFVPPQGYQRVSIEPDRQGIRKALEAGETMEGARLVDGEPVVRIIR